MYILFFARGYLIFVGRKAGEHAKRRNVMDDRWKREVRGDEVGIEDATRHGEARLYRRKE